MTGVVVAAAGACAVVAAARRGVLDLPGWAGARGGRGERWTCACGTRFRVAGAGRHRVLWLADAPEDEPVLGDRCPRCDAPLPGAAAGAPAVEGAATAR